MWLNPYDPLMRKGMAVTVLALIALGIGGSASPASATAKDFPVEVRQECGSYNVYVFGTPLITWVWCPDPA